jgi:hypothetical protein
MDLLACVDANHAMLTFDHGENTRSNALDSRHAHCCRGELMQLSLVLLLRHQLTTRRIANRRLTTAATMTVQAYQQLAKQLTTSQPSPGPR